MPRSDTHADPGEPLTTRSVREVLVDLSQTEDALREWRTRTGRREVPVLDVHALVSRQRELVDELRRLSSTTGLTAMSGPLDDRQDQSPQVAS